MFYNIKTRDTAFPLFFIHKKYSDFLEQKSALFDYPRYSYVSKLFRSAHPISRLADVFLTL